MPWHCGRSFGVQADPGDLTPLAGRWGTGCVPAVRVETGPTDTEAALGADFDGAGGALPDGTYTDGVEDAACEADFVTLWLTVEVV